MTIEEAGSPNRREEGSNAGCLTLQSGRKSPTVETEHADADRIASCEAGHERIVPASKDWTEQAILTIPPDDSEPFFPACRTCPEQGIAPIQMMLGADGVLHIVKACRIKFRDVEAI